MSEFIILAALILIVGVVLYTKKHPEIANDIHARLDETEANVQAMINNRKPSAPVGTITAIPGELVGAPTVDHAAIVTAAGNAAVQLVQAATQPPVSVPATIPVAVTVDTSAPVAIAPAKPVEIPPPEPVSFGPAAPGPVPPEFDGHDLWRKGAVWRCQLEAGKGDSRNFTVPDGYTGVIEYIGDNAAMQGDFTVRLDAQPLLGAGQQVFLTPGPHTLSAVCVDPLSVGRTFAVANLSIVHNP